jgi:hypothetical protein
VGYEPLEGSEFKIEGDYVIASYGFPFAAVLLTGYIIYFLILVTQPVSCSIIPA